jgi:hypothetical protein
VVDPHDLDRPASVRTSAPAPGRRTGRHGESSASAAVVRLRGARSGCPARSGHS